MTSFNFTVEEKPPRPVQYFSEEYLQRCKNMTPEQIVAFLEEFAMLQYAVKLTPKITDKTIVSIHQDSQ